MRRSRDMRRQANQNDAKMLAAQDWVQRSESRNPEFLREYPDMLKYVREWWEERYLPIILEQRGRKVA